MQATRPLFFALFAAIALSTATPASSQEPPAGPDEAAELPAADESAGIDISETVLWDIRGDDAARLDAFRKGVQESLADTAERHILSEIAFTEYLAKRAPNPPVCLRGVSDCVAPGAIVFDALDLSSMVRVDVLAVGANYSVTDSRGQAVREGEVVESDARKLGFAVVRDIFDATGIVTIDSKPQGATVEIDGRSVGTTPLTYRLAVGEHTYRLRAADRNAVDGFVTVASGRGVTVQHDLDMTPGTLLVQDAPEGAEVYVNGKLAGQAGEPIALEPGNYTLEIRAPGFAAVQDSVTVEPGRIVKRSAPLQSSNTFLGDISSDAIIFNNYILRFGFEGGLQRATFQDARSNDDIPYEFISFADNNGNLPGGGLVLNESLGTLGMRFDAAYGLKRFGIVALSLSYLTRKVNFPGYVAQRGDSPQPVTITSVKRLQVRPFQIFYRHFYNNFVPFAEAGIGINFSWLQAEGAIFEGPKTLRRTDALWTLALGAQYYFTANIFGMARYSVQDYFERGLGTDHQFSIGFGAAFPNLFGFDPEPPEKL